MAHKPDSVFKAVIHLDFRSPGSSSGQPEPIGAGNPQALLDLAPGGVCPARSVTRPTVSSYLTISPLSATKCGGRYGFCGTFQPSRAAPVRSHPPCRSPDFPPVTICDGRLPGPLQKRLFSMNEFASLSASLFSSLEI